MLWVAPRSSTLLESGSFSNTLKPSDERSQYLANSEQWSVTVNRPNHLERQMDPGAMAKRLIAGLIA
jgi:hypothetical protein